MIFLLSGNAYAEKSYVINIPSGAASPQAPYFWQSEKDGNTDGLIEVAVGDTVTWMNADTVQHTVVSGNPDDGPNGVFDSGLIKMGSSFSQTFDHGGTFDYFCSLHPWMTGTVTVSLVYNVLHDVGKKTGDGKTFYDVEYLFDRLLSVNSIDASSKSIMFEIVGRADEPKSSLVLRLPSGLIDGPFTVWIDGDKVDYEQSTEDNIQIITMQIPSSSKILTISGTHVVPEFGIALFVMFSGIIAVLFFSRVITKKIRIR